MNITLPGFTEEKSIRFENNPLSFPKSPLRYPGGKARAVSIILNLIPSNITKLVSPFLGGGSVEIAVASKGIQVLGFDIFEPLVNFWQILLSNPKRLANQVEKYYPLSKNSFYQLQKVQIKNKIDRAAVFYVLNRCSFSGSTLSGGMSPGHPRFTRSSINYLRQFSCNNLNVKKSDFKVTIQKYKNDFLYLDPPYLISSALYGKNGDTHKDFDHEGLCRLLKARNNWILSYNDIPKIRELYFGYRFVTPRWKYGMSDNKDSRELLIISNDLPDFEDSKYA